MRLVLEFPENETYTLLVDKEVNKVVAKFNYDDGPMNGMSNVVKVLKYLEVNVEIPTDVKKDLR